MLVYNFDPTLAPAGKTVIVVSYSTDYDYWHELRQDPVRYKAEKERIANEVIAGLEQKFPGISSQVEMRDVATPITWERYTGNWRGAYEGWMFGTFDNISKTLPDWIIFIWRGNGSMLAAACLRPRCPAATPYNLSARRTNRNLLLPSPDDLNISRFTRR